MNTTCCSQCSQNLSGRTFCYMCNGHFGYVVSHTTKNLKVKTMDIEIGREKFMSLIDDAIDRAEEDYKKKVAKDEEDLKRYVEEYVQRYRDIKDYGLTTEDLMSADAFEDPNFMDIGTKSVVALKVGPRKVHSVETNDKGKVIREGETEIPWKEVVKHPDCFGGEVVFFDYDFGGCHPSYDPTKTYKVYRVDWVERERGWGVEDDGYSVHLSLEDVATFFSDFWDKQPDETPDIINLVFSDVPWLDHQQAMQRSDAERILKFADDKFKRGYDELYVHCTMGVSRSGAVGEHLAGRYGTLERFYKENYVTPNGGIVSLMWDVGQEMPLR